MSVDITHDKQQAVQQAEEIVTKWLCWPHEAPKLTRAIACAILDARSEEAWRCGAPEGPALRVAARELREGNVCDPVKIPERLPDPIEDAMRRMDK